MPTSAADDAGILDDDLLVSFTDQQMFNWNDLQNASTEGTRDELVDVIMLGENSHLAMTIPRGPLGVRLILTHIDPDAM